ncbi:hypothetical protein K470DRAFT_29734 [Piedraia hortae CBS 480.64]|uniref:Uncharacterized protein n=1 Tax=Piedraia hortae CBS 480.64 TaxID=1314780 RepID=A0A6A7C3C9_9PEZI|nr:hypothetical protein K470DRAFT_29734 [Piedraia hortae CBS 480.64]
MCSSLRDGGICPRESRAALHKRGAKLKPATTISLSNRVKSTSLSVSQTLISHKPSFYPLSSSGSSMIVAAAVVVHVGLRCTRLITLWLPGFANRRCIMHEIFAIFSISFYTNRSSPFRPITSPEWLVIRVFQSHPQDVLDSSRAYDSSRVEVSTSTSKRHPPYYP